MLNLTLEGGRIKITMQYIEIGEDLFVIITGGSKPHIGCVTLSTPRQSVVDKSTTSATTSILNVIGHKDDYVAKYVSHKLSSKLNRIVGVICGIHLDNIKDEEIKLIMKLIEELTEMVIHDLFYRKT